MNALTGALDLCDVVFHYKWQTDALVLRVEELFAEEVQSFTPFK